MNSSEQFLSWLASVSSAGILLFILALIGLFIRKRKK